MCVLQRVNLKISREADIDFEITAASKKLAWNFKDCYKTTWLLEIIILKPYSKANQRDHSVESNESSLSKTLALVL